MGIIYNDSVVYRVNMTVALPDNSVSLLPIVEISSVNFSISASCDTVKKNIYVNTPFAFDIQLSDLTLDLDPILTSTVEGVNVRMVNSSISVYGQVSSNGTFKSTVDGFSRSFGVPTGTLAQFELTAYGDDCELNAGFCKNNATCVDGTLRDGNVTCQCTGQWAGMQCDILANVSFVCVVYVVLCCVGCVVFVFFVVFFVSCVLYVCVSVVCVLCVACVVLCALYVCCVCVE